ncbi:3-hydroxyacyl-ACP dehydratase FabZ family protein [Goodfellowiella coeruleoviolacea]|uniref:3-hydroxyacyl-[acyl-carrier-protein] dehydratase n=1 Tax=Goodfellowiella coeruleoviolacea TaxID=334858 RepID=A0AAE3G7W9_9PSEU|nr:MaoC/PaaZ C-terminal domain-containing protein [Goodfellowiella coeruleoviolacea]MCP2163195.1 3-hydroxyacyl-[acyl-carrier-protein] dehydratase [Goodfellowiella coeruleoviolacea]
MTVHLDRPAEVGPGQPGAVDAVRDDTGARAVSPVAGAVHRTGPAEVTFTVSADEPVFAGHYPNFPIFPGMCVLEIAHRGALLTAPEPGLALAAMKSARFTAPVFAGDRLTVAVDWKRDRERWTCVARARAGDRDVAVVRLDYRAGGDR